MDPVRFDSASVVTHPANPRRQRSAGVTASLILHAIGLAIIAAMIAPAQIGQGVRSVLTIRFADEQNEQPTPTFVISPELPAPDAAEPDLQPVELFATSTIDLAPAAPGLTAADAAGAAGQSGGASGAIGGDQSGARGTFFGISATGHTFVYILDKSGSMGGDRYRRAADELIRSVDALHSTQQFYVFLFSDEVTAMFDSPSPLPLPVRATTQNKQRLATWLDGVKPGGSTNPTEALRLSMRMGGSAIFLLSDGEFDRRSGRRKASPLQPDQDAFGIVAAGGGDQPIHTVALESASGSQSLKRLSSMTAGEYRFVASDSFDPKLKLAAAIEARRDGRVERAKELFREVISTASPDLAATASREYESALTVGAESVLIDGGLPQLCEMLGELMLVGDPLDTPSPMQTQIVSRIAEVLGQSVAASIDEALPPLQSLLGEHAAMPAIVSLRQQVWPALINTFELLPTPADVETRLPLAASFWSPALSPTESAQLNATIDALTDVALEQSSVPRQSGPLNDFGRLLIALQVKLDQFPAAQSKIEVRRRDLIFSELAAARDARMRRDRRGASFVKNRLRTWLSQTESISDYTIQFAGRETEARAEFRRLAKIHGRSTNEAAGDAYRRFVDDHRHTLAAVQAAELIDDPPAGQATAVPPMGSPLMDIFMTRR